MNVHTMFITHLFPIVLLQKSMARTGALHSHSREPINLDFGGENALEHNTIAPLVCISPITIYTP